jgi:hypothetical protein
MDEELEKESKDKRVRERKYTFPCYPLFLFPVPFRPTKQKSKFTSILWLLTLLSFPFIQITVSHNRGPNWSVSLLGNVTWGLKATNHSSFPLKWLSPEKIMTIYFSPSSFTPIRRIQIHLHKNLSPDFPVRWFQLYPITNISSHLNLLSYCHSRKPFVKP